MADTTIEILIRAQENVSQAVNEVKQQLEGLAQHTESVVGRINYFFQQNEKAFLFFTKIGAIVSGTYLAIAASSTRYVNQLRQEALQIGTTLEKYSVYRAMLEDLEIHAEMLPMFIMRMQVAFQQAAAAVATKGEKANELTALIAHLGQTIQAQATDPLDQFVMLLQKISEMPDQARRVQLVFELFGRRAYTLLPILREGTFELERLVARYRELGVAISDEVGNKIDEMSDKLSTLRASIKATAAQLFAPAAEGIGKVAEKATEGLGKFKEVLQQQPTLNVVISYLVAGVTAILTIVGALGVVGQALKWIGDGLKSLGATKIVDWLKNAVGWFGKFWEVLKTIGSLIFTVVRPIIFGIGAIAIAIAYLIRKIDEKTGKISNWLAKLMLPKEMRPLVEEGERARKEAEEWEQAQKAQAAKAERGIKTSFGYKAREKPTAFGVPLFDKEFEDLQRQLQEEERKLGKQVEKSWQDNLVEIHKDMADRWNKHLFAIRHLLEAMREARNKFYEDIKRKYFEWVDKQKEALERVTRAEEEMRRRMAEAYESAARLAANLAARAGVYTIRFGSFGYFAIPVVQEAQPVTHTPSREEMTLGYTAYIYFYAQQIWLSIQNIIVLLQQAVGHLAFIAQAIAKSAGGATLNVNVPFGYDQIRNAIADAVNETLGRQLAHELVRNA
jgi:hypothetical protein